MCNEGIRTKEYFLNNLWSTNIKNLLVSHMRQKQEPPEKPY